MSSLATLIRSILPILITYDTATIGPYLHDDFEFCFLPSSMGVSQMNKSGYLAWLATFKNLISHLELEEVEMIEWPGSDMTLVHLRGKGTFVSKAAYANEYMILFRFKDNKLVSMKEFADSAYVGTAVLPNL